jgi:HEPN domain-containing protein
MGNDQESRQQELARLLLQKASQDLEAVKNLSGSENIADEIIGFHAQQTIEKALKAVLTRKGIEYSFTHDLLTLFEQVKDAGLKTPTNPEAVDGLTAFAVQFRYTLYDDEPFDRQVAVQLAITYVEWARGIIEWPSKTEGTAESETLKGEL